MRSLVLAAAALALAGCKEKDIEPPAELTEFEQTLQVERVWTAAVGGDAQVLRLGLGLATAGDFVYAAGRGGEVAAFALANGRPAWRTQTRAQLAGGTGTDGELVAVGSSDGEVIALSATDGAQRWRVNVGGEVLSAPAVSARLIALRTVDGRLVALSPENGRELWVHQEQVPLLTLRGAARPVISDDLVISGFDNGKVVALNVGDGSLAWETPVSPPRGRTELERLVDIDSAVAVSNDDVFTAGFQGRVAMLARNTGQIWWARDASSHRGVSVDADAAYIATAGGEVVALRRATGVELWRQDALLRRGLSAPSAGERGIAVADFQGYVHWLDRATGSLAARASSGDARVTNPPLTAGELTLVISDQGRITAFRARARGQAEQPAPKSEQPAPESERPAEEAAQPPADEPGQ